ncbi:putative ABC transporter permease subunit [Robinsoniella peoriensis]|uniref:putative ABC transporter permease subunit n=1 Tax=Robinsoniella peoriensis TaxID=180332 RepID=UPI003634D937
MHKFFILTKILLKSGLGMTPVTKNGSSQNKKRSAGGNSQLLLLVVLAVCLLPLAGSLFAFGRTFYHTFAQLNMPETPVQLLCYAASFTVLVFALPYVVSVFFLSSDLETLLPLPLKPWQIIGAKFTAVLIYEYLIIALFILPPFIGYGFEAQGGVLFWLFMILVVLVLPVIPLIYASLIAILMMRVFKNIKNKEMISTVCSFLMIFIICGASMMVNRTPDAAQMANLVIANKNLLDKLNIIFPNLTFAGDALVHSSIVSMLLFILLAGVFLVIFLFIADRIYFGGVMGIQEVTSKRKKMSQTEKESYSRSKSPVKAYAIKEFKLLFRTPVYFMNCLMTPLIFPLLIGIPIIISLAGSKVSLLPILTQLASTAGNTVTAVLLLLSFVLPIFIGGSCMVTSTCISREGQGYIFMKYIPMSIRDQLRAKILNGFLICLAATLPYTIICTVLGLVLLNANFLVIILCPVITVLTLLMINYAALWADLTNPKLIWESEQAAVKQNFTATILLFAVWIVGFAMAGGAFALYIILGLPSILIALFFCIVLGILLFVIRNGVYSYGAKRIDELD